MANDTEIIDWMESHVTELGLNVPANQIRWQNSKGHHHSTDGDNLRDCVNKAMRENE